MFCRKIKKCFTTDGHVAGFISLVLGCQAREQTRLVADRSHRFMEEVVHLFQYIVRVTEHLTGEL